MRHEEAIVEECLREFQHLQTWRNTTAGHWEEIAQLIWPEHRNTFFFGSYVWPGEKKTQRQIDATGMMALNRFKSILDSLLTPRNMFWHGLAANDDYIMKQRGVREWFETVTKTLFKYRYAPLANFSSQNLFVWKSLGAFGTGAMFVDALHTPHGMVPGIRYKAIPLGELFIRENHQGIVDSFIRWFRLTARQAYQKWGPEKFPQQLKHALEQGSEQPFNFIHCVKPNQDYVPGMLTTQGKPFVSYYISLEGRVLLEEGGYYSFPLACSRYDQAPMEIYGRSPAMCVLPALKTLNAQKTVFLQQGHRAADPVLLTGDDGLMSMDRRPGAINPGGVTPDGKPLVVPLPTGNIDINEKMMMEEKSLINDAFFVTLFQILTETPTMTATEVIERTNEKGILLAPEVGRQQSEYLSPLIDRELDLLAQQRLIPPMPEILREAGGEYQVIYTSPISRAMRAQEAAGFIRTVETAKEIVNITQDPSYLDPFDFDVAIPAIADIQGTPLSWMATEEKIKAKRQARAQAQQAQMQIQAMPAQAAMIKAQAAVQKAQPAIVPPGGTIEGVV
jgi:hypothetical protein